MNKIILCFCFCFLMSMGETCLAQSDIELSYERKSDNTVDFNYSKKVFGTYYLLVEFNDLSNAIQSSYGKHVSGNIGHFYTLKPSDPNQGIGFSYSYRFQRGKFKPRIKDDLIYLLPFRKGVKSKMYDLSYLGSKLGKVKSSTWKAFQFLTDKEEVVVAVRKGLVVEVTDEFSNDTTKNYSYKRSVNEVLIEHKDGTLANYTGFKAGSIKVKEGQYVNPHDELGLSGRYNSRKQHQLRLMIYYLNTRDISGIDTDEERANQFAYLNPIFYYKGGNSILLQGNEYVAECNDEIIKQEFSRREKKKYVSKL